jgi:hypothetical protein
MLPTMTDEMPDKKDKGPRRPPGRRPAETLLTVPQVAALKGVTEAAIRHACSRGAIPADRLGSRWIIRKSDAEAWEPNPKMGRPKKATPTIIDEEPVLVDEAVWERLKQIVSNPKGE